MVYLAANAQKDFELSATEVAQRMGVGWNLGNTLEAGNSAHIFTNKGGLGAETAWQSTKTSQAIIDYVRSLGFRSIRIPCAWVMGHITDKETNQIDPKWMARVKEIVDYCIKADMYVMLNQHWDGGWLENNIKDNSKKEANKLVLEQIWTQIANEFKDYDERLLFAGLNEPNAENQAETNNLIEYEQVFINTVRATGGNNEKRILVVQGPSTNIDHTCNFYKTMPTDPTATDRLMMEVHYYAPWQFWGMKQDESWGRMFYYWGKDNHVAGSKHNPDWDCEEAYMESQLKLMKRKFCDKGIPVIIGEFGAEWRNLSGKAGESQEKHDASIRLHYYLLHKLCLDMGIVPMAWDTNYLSYSMTIIDRKGLKVFNPIMMDAIRQAMDEHPAAVQVPLLPSATTTAYDLCGRPATAQQHGIVVSQGKKMIR